MKKAKLILLTGSVLMAVPFVSGCAAQMLEKNLNVVFMNEGEVVDSGVVNQYKNIKSPSIDAAYIPTDYRFLGWTCYSLNQLDYKDATHFKTQYIGAGRMVHYMDVQKFAEGSTVILEALMLHKDEIPKDYHYAVVAWYDKTNTTAMTAAQVNECEQNVKTYLLSEGVSQEDVNTVVFRAYTGNVGPSTGQILYDDDVDIMLGWGDVNNITTTGSIPVESIYDSDTFTAKNGDTTKTRYIYRISENAGGIKVMEYLKTDEAKAVFSK